MFLQFHSSIVAEITIIRLKKFVSSKESYRFQILNLDKLKYILSYRVQEWCFSYSFLIYSNLSINRSNLAFTFVFSIDNQIFFFFRCRSINELLSNSSDGFESTLNRPEKQDQTELLDMSVVATTILSTIIEATPSSVTITNSQQLTKNCSHYASGEISWEFAMNKAPIAKLESLEELDHRTGWILWEFRPKNQLSKMLFFLEKIISIAGLWQIPNFFNSIWSVPNAIDSFKNKYSS